MAVPEHVFLSHSVQDVDEANSLSFALHVAGLPIWIDSFQLTPGTPDWESAVRDGFARSYAVVVLASPEARASKYVRAELALAEALGCQIFPVWIRGEKWVDCISLGLTQSQYIDMRGGAREQGIQMLIQNLTAKVAELTSDHYLVAPLWNVSQDPKHPGATRARPLPGYVCIELPRAIDEREDPFNDPGRGVFVRLAAYKTVWHLLDALFVHYLADYFRPHTYGLDWILREDHGACGRVLASWHWVQSIGKDIHQDNRSFRDISLNTAGIVTGSRWRVSRVGSFTPVALAAREPAILEVLRTSPKAFYALRHEGIVEHWPIDRVGSEFIHRYVVWFHYDWENELSSDLALVQVRNDPAELEFWLGYW